MRVKFKNRKNTFSDMIWIGLNSGIIAVFILFIGMDITIEEFLPNLLLPGWSTFFFLPITFLLTSIPCYLINKKPFMTEVNNSGFNEKLLSLSTSKLAIVYLVTCLFEELLFRVAIQGSISKFIGLPMAIGIVSILFALMHFRYIKYWQLTLVSIWVGVVWGTLYGITGSWIIVSMAHFAHNFILSSIEKRKNFNSIQNTI